MTQFELLEKISFVRLSGSKEELKAANMLKEEVDSLCVDSWMEQFKVGNYKIQKAELEVLEPFKRTIEVTGVGFSGSTAEDGLVADFLYVEEAEEIDLIHAKDNVVLVNGRMKIETYKRLAEAGVAGILTHSGVITDDIDKTDITQSALRSHHLKHGKIPSVVMRVTDAIDLVRDGASKVKMTVIQEETEVNSQNVIAEVKGSMYPDQVVVFMAHYDSVPYSSGAYDNGAGSVAIMDVLKHFVKNQPKRTVRFCWFGSEEVGLLGSKAYVEQHKDELDEVLFGINVDVAAAVIGRDRAMVLGEESIVNVIEFFAKEINYPMSAKQSIYSSDCVPFGDKGIPVVNFMRFGAMGAAQIHNRFDTMDFLSSKSLERTTNFVIQFSEKVINTDVFPIKRSMPENMVKEINKYLRKEKCKKHKENKEAK